MIAAAIVALALGQAGAAPVLTLEAALREAQEKNLDLKQAQARLDQSNQLSWKAWSYYLPQVTAGATWTRNETEATLQVPGNYAIRDFGPGGVPAPPGLPGGPTPYGIVPYDITTFYIQKRDQLGAQVEVRQAILAPALWPAIRNAYRGEKVASLTVENARREVLFGVTQAYYGAVGLKAALQVAERQLELTRQHEKDARVRYQAGTTPKVALLRAQIDRSKAEEDLKRSQNALSTAKLSLATLLDRSAADFDVETPPEPQVSTDAAQLEKSAMEERPDVKAADVGVELAQGQRNGSWARYAPSVGAFASYRWANLKGFTGKETAWALGLALTWNIFDGGLREAELRENQARIVEAEAAKRSADARALQDVRRALLDLDSARANRAKAREVVDLARENQKLVEVNFKAGAATYIEVADATESLRQAELAQVAESLNADLAAIQVQKAAGLFKPGTPF